ncbi:hypothetical protein [Streptomyces sp. XD-27]|uniref:hypothetical protein n=1 Tax=Streptomyces sp. XD-27 TaxID=3062779 RepID=UPI0026F43180|nr:hypothetical protein [Streptomyces sp. XD-27]WKX72416.1 hypothetical protein Q3Y56_23170 [Streptomyces sp. XD-27]
MSRESDSSSSGPRGRGGSAYPSGTPPYGSRQYPSPNPTQEGSYDRGDDAEARDAAEPEEPKTETTLTTRIRINIPGSRPIPPVVMRTPVGDDGAAAGAGEDEEHSGGAATGPDATAAMAAVPGAGQDPAATAASASRQASGAHEAKEPEKTSDWFAPRKQARATPAAPSAPQGATGAPASPTGPAASADGPRPGSSAPGAGAPLSGSPLSSDPSGPETTQAFPAPTPPGQGQDADTPYFSDFSDFSGFAVDDPTPTGPTAITPDLGPEDPLTAAGQNPLNRFPSAPSGRPGPSGPTTGPVGGDMAVPPVPSPGAGAVTSTPPDGTPLFDPLGAHPATPSDGTPLFDPLGAHSATPPDGTPLFDGLGGQPPTPPGGASLPGGLGATTGGGQPPAGPTVGSDLFRDPEPAPGGGAPGHVSGETLISGIPVVPPSENRPVTPFPGFASDSGATPAPGGDSTPPSPPAPAASSAKPAKKKGRNKLVLLGAALVGAVGVAYAAGLVMNHADVPNGTTVLGIDIGGTSKQEAIDKLDAGLGKRAQAPLKVSVDGDQHELKPSVAGLALDTEQTVRDVSGRDYNPVNVIGSLFGGTRTAGDPVVVDEEKLSDALERLAGESGTAREGTITFAPGKVEAVYGKPGKGLDVDAAVKAVSEAYRERAETGANKAVTLPVVTKQPKIGKAEVDRMMKEFAEPAMSGLVTIKAGGKSIDFGPARSLPKILSVTVVEDPQGKGYKLQESYDLEAVKELYGNIFDGVLIERAQGGKTPVQPTDVVGALRSVILEKDPAKRIAEIPLSPS